MEIGKSLLLHRTFEFAINMVEIHKQLCQDEKEFTMSKQLLRSGTAVGALVREAKYAESTRDFIHKLSVALKECNECLYWLELLKATHYLDEQEFTMLHANATIIAKMLAKSIVSCKSKNTITAHDV